MGTIKSYYSSTVPYGWLACDGTDTTSTSNQLSTYHQELYAFLGNSNVLPDLRECSLVGIGQSSRSILGQSGHSHDVYTLGQFKDDQIQNHTHTRGTMEITGKFGNFGVYSNGESEGVFYLDILGNSGVNGSNGHYAIANFQASRNWTGSTSNPSGRGGDTTHGKQVGVNFIIKY